MPASDKPKKRRYDAPLRAARAAQTRDTVVLAAKQTYEEHGWSGSTIKVIATAAAVSRQTVEAIFGTKAVLLRAAVDLAIRGDTRPLPMPQRRAVGEMERADTAASMLDLHARHVRTVNGRSARIAWVVEHAAASDPDVSALWETMAENRRYAVAWAASTLLEKRDAPHGLERGEVEETFWVGIDWRLYRSLTEERGLSPAAFERWLRRYYRAMLGV